ncbi:MAG: WG repeat-containing protein [Bacteroidetes bacterium]|nr:WG repeat-containing protein [Bacteroidota bacterium]HET6243188.1 WG repeat-containing protein [Bacteroidia bacterium]
MKLHANKKSLVLILLLFCFISCVQTNKMDDYLISFSDEENNDYGYKNKMGDTIIPPGKYTICFTDTFKTYAIVFESSIGFVAIDRQENILYKVYPFDNGPDYQSDGCFRITHENKIGFAEAESGKIIIEPQFDCAYPFEKGLAKVSINCQAQSEGEHALWISENWFYIDKTGKKFHSPTNTK